MLSFLTLTWLFVLPVNSQTVNFEKIEATENNNSTHKLKTYTSAHLYVTHSPSFPITTRPIKSDILITQQSTQENPELAKAEKLNQEVLNLIKEGKYQEAIPLAQQALEIRQTILGKEHIDVAVSLNNLASLYESLGEYEKALPLYQEALAIFQKRLGEENTAVAISLNNLAHLYQLMGRYEQALSFYQKTLEMRRKILGNEHPDVAISLNNLASLYESLGEYEKALSLYQKALEMLEKLLGKEHLDVALSLNNLAGLYSTMGQYKKALSLYQNTLEIRQKLLGEEHPSVATSFNNLASVYESMGRYEEALPLYQQALKMRQKLLGEEHPDVAVSLNNLAGLYLAMGQYQEALALFQEALAMLKKLLGEEHPNVALSLNNLAHLYSTMGQYEKALPLFQQALAIHKKVLGEEHPSVAQSFNNLAYLYSAMGRYEDALSLSQQALAIHKKVLGEEHPDVAIDLNNLAGYYTNMGQYEKARTLYQQALKMRQNLLGEEHPDIAQSLNNLGYLYQSIGEYEKALLLHQQALEMKQKLLEKKHPDIAVSLNNLGYLYQSIEEYEKALLLHQQALEIRQKLLGEKHPSVASSLNNLAILYLAQEDITNALKVRDKALDIEEFNLTRHLIVGSEDNKLQYMATLSGSTDATVSFHLQDSSDNPLAARQALTTILRRKGRILDLLTNNQQILRQQLEPENKALLDELIQVNTQLTNLLYLKPEQITSPEEHQQAIEELATKAQELEAKLSRLSDTFKVETEPVTIETIQALIPENTALIEIVRYQTFDPKTDKFGAYHYGAYILRSTGDPVGIDLGDAATIDDQVENFRVNLARDIPIKQSKASGKLLEKLVFAKIRSLLKQNEKILLSPDGDLNLIPFEALVDENNDYLVQNYTFTYLTSGRDLIRLAAHSPSNATPVFMGHPNFKDPGTIAQRSANSPLSSVVWTALPQTENEINAIAALFNNSQVFMQEEASEITLKQVQQPSILHIATHGFFENPRQFPNPLAASGLALSGIDSRLGGEAENGLFTALEVTSLDLVGTQLVVLSACDTGLGKVAVGEGIYGLKRAFVIAGTQTQMISLWRVDDEGTKDLMVAYYNKLLKEKKGRTQGLRELQLSMINGEKGENYQHPYYWASFILSGESKGLTF